jgi:hypothetical protein
MLRQAVIFSLVFIAVPAAAFGQLFSFGVKAGVPFGDPYSVPFRNLEVDRKYWTVGPTMEFGLPAGFSIGFDALYQPVSFRSFSGIPGASYSSRGEGSRWDFPLYLMYKFGPNLPVRPFVSAGAVAGGSFHSVRTVCGGDLCGGGSPSTDSLSEAGAGFVVGGGVEVKLPFRMRIAPEVRYTNWQAGLLASRRLNQTSLLVGFRF